MERMGDFLLNSELAKRLYHDGAADLPVIDYHNHLAVEEIDKDYRFENLYDLWIRPDPYKHRAMRMCGVPEEQITGGASAEEKFQAWCTIFPELVGNPLYQWSLMELRDVLEIQELPSAENWKALWRNSGNYLEKNPVTARGILKKYRVEYNSPCATLTDDLSLYLEKEDLAPSLRGDTVVAPVPEAIEKLEKLTELPVKNLEQYRTAVSIRLRAFKKAGCRFADHSLDNGFRYYEEDGKNELRFQKALSGELSTKEEKDRLMSGLLRFLGGQYAALGIVMQLHMGAQRTTSTRLRKIAGAAGGYACIGNSIDVDSLTRFLDDLERQVSGMPRVILFALNPSDHAMISALAGSYSKDGVAGLVTQGPAWWWCDHNYGMESLLENTAVYGLLSNFAGMTTDSRSFLSFIRHDYFRRILCDWLARQAMEQKLPDSPEILKACVYRMCYGNAKKILEEG